MDEWFKFHTTWFTGIERLKSDPESIGRFMIALMDFISTGTEQVLPGKEDILLAMAVADLKVDMEQRQKRANDASDLSDKRSKAAMTRWHKDQPAPETDTHASNCMQMDAIAYANEQSDADGCKTAHKNKEIRYKNTDTDTEKEKEKEIKETAAGGGVKESQKGSAGAARKQTGQRPPESRYDKITEQQYTQRPNTEPDSNAVPAWLQEARNRESAADPEGA